MTDLSKEFLHRILKSIPEHQRLQFLEEVLATMEPESRRRILQEGTFVWNSKPEPSVMQMQIPEPEPSVIPVKIPNRPALEPPAGRKSAPLVIPTAARAKPEPSSPDANQALALAEAEFTKLKIQHASQGSRENMRSEMISCMAYAVGALTLITLMAVGGSKLWEWLKSTIQSF